MIIANRWGLVTAGLAHMVLLGACSPTKAPADVVPSAPPDPAEVLVDLYIMPHRVEIAVGSPDLEEIESTAARDLECKVSGEICVPENLDEALGCRGSQACIALWENVASEVSPSFRTIGHPAPFMGEPELGHLRRSRLGDDEPTPTHIRGVIHHAVQARAFLAPVPYLAWIMKLEVLELIVPIFHPNGLARFEIDVATRVLGEDEPFVDRPHIVLLPDAFEVWTLGAEEPTRIPRPSPLEGWRELALATRALDPRGHDHDTLLIAIHPEVRFWVLWRTLALVGLRYEDGAFDGGRDPDTVTPIQDGDGPARRFRSVRLDLHRDGMPATQEEVDQLVRARALAEATAYLDGRLEIPSEARQRLIRPSSLTREGVVEWWSPIPGSEHERVIHAQVRVDLHSGQVLSWGPGTAEFEE